MNNNKLSKTEKARLHYHWQKIKDDACDRWQHFPTFAEDLRALPYNHHLDKQDPTKPYAPDNVIYVPTTAWGAQKKARRYRWQGKLLTIKELSELTQQPTERIRRRLALGWTLKRALTE